MEIRGLGHHHSQCFIASASASQYSNDRDIQIDRDIQTAGNV